MKLQASSSFAIAAICLFATISSVKSQCCDFATTMCGWSSGSWLTTPDEYPDLKNYPSFTATQPSDEYTFIQDTSGTDSTTSTFYIASQGVVFSFDYFMDSYESKSINNKLEVYFESGAFTTMLTIIMTKSDSWQHVDIQCTGANSFCCPNDIVPCEGSLKLSAIIDAAYPIGLFAVDNIGLGCPSGLTTAVIDPTQTTISTTPSTPHTTDKTLSTDPTLTTTVTTTSASKTTTAVPVPTTCCDFEADDCGAAGASWYWSESAAPSITIPPNTGAYMWSNAPGQLQFVESNDVSTTATITFNYFIHTSTTSISVTFYPTTGTPETLDLGSFTPTAGAWGEVTALCTACCGSGTTCDGTFIIATSGITTDFEVAIDNMNIDDQCRNKPGCCLFDDTDICGYTYDATLWFYSPDFTPKTTPTSGSDYIFYAPTSASSTAVISSPSMTINSDTRFRGNLYVKNAEAENTFKVSFFNDDNGISVPLGTVPDTVDLFRVFDYDCTASNCCNGKATCTGRVQLRADIVATPLDSDLYAIDAFEIIGSCDLFPGSSDKAYDVHNGRKRLKFY